MREAPLRRTNEGPASGRPGTRARGALDDAALRGEDPVRRWLVELQRSAGNAAVVDLIRPRTAVQRDLAATHVLAPADEPDVPTASQTTELVTEWTTLNNKKKAAAKGGPAFEAADAARLAEVDRLIGLRQKKDVALTLEGNGYKDGPARWFADVKPVTFLGQSVTVHSLLAARLAEAERNFLDAVKGQPVPTGGWVRSTSSIRGPTAGLHGLGLAVDLNPGTNPYLVSPGSGSEASTGEPLARSRAVRDVIDRAVLLVLGRTAKDEDFGAQPDIADRAARVTASYRKLDEASHALQTYLTLADPANRAALDTYIGSLGTKDPLKRTADDWIKAIRADKSGLATQAAAKQWSSPEKGFLDLDSRLVQALTNAGLTWLGDVVVGSGRDIMHFDMRGLGPVRRIWKSSNGSWVNLGG